MNPSKELSTETLRIDNFGESSAVDITEMTVWMITCFLLIVCRLPHIKRPKQMKHWRTTIFQDRLIF